MKSAAVPAFVQFCAAFLRSHLLGITCPLCCIHFTVTSVQRRKIKAKNLNAYATFCQVLIYCYSCSIHWQTLRANMISVRWSGTGNVLWSRYKDPTQTQMLFLIYSGSWREEKWQQWIRCVQLLCMSVFHQGVYLGESTSLSADLRLWNKQWFLLNWGEIWGLKGSQDGTWTPFFLLQNRSGCRGSFDVCFGSASPTLEYVLGRPTVTCLQAESQSPGSWPSLMKYFRESLTLLMPMCASSLLFYPLVLSHLSLPQTLPAHPHTSLSLSLPSPLPRSSDSLWENHNKDFVSV